jgi:hypothetical protein
MEGEGEIGNFDSASKKCDPENGNCENTEAKTDDRNGERSETGESEQRLVVSRRKLTQ